MNMFVCGCVLCEYECVCASMYVCVCVHDVSMRSMRSMRGMIVMKIYVDMYMCAH